MRSAPPESDRFYELFLQSGVAQALIATDGTITTINAAAAKLFDRRPEELEGQALLPRLPEHDARRGRRAAPRADRGPAAFHRRKHRRSGHNGLFSDLDPLRVG